MYRFLPPHPTGNWSKIASLSLSAKEMEILPKQTDFSVSSITQVQTHKGNWISKPSWLLNTSY